MGFFGKGWFRRVLRVAVGIVATAINPAIGAILIAAFEYYAAQKSFDDNEDPVVVKEVTDWIESKVTPLILAYTPELNMTNTLVGLTNFSALLQINRVLRNLAILKVYFSYKAEKEKDARTKKIYQYKAETFDFFIRNITEGYIDAIRKKLNGKNLSDVIRTKKITTEANARILGTIIMDWSDAKVNAIYTVFSRKMTDEVIPLPRPSTGDLNDPISDPDPIVTDPVIISDPIVTPDPIVVTDSGSGSGSGGNTIDPIIIDTGGEDQKKSNGFPWIWIAGGLIAYQIIKKK